eukprot:sb/3461443/
MDDLQLAVSFWTANDPPPSSHNTTTGVKIPNQKDLSKFQTSHDLSHSVILHVGQSHFRVNSLILALHSSVFERLLFSGLDEIEIETSLQRLENIEEAVYTSILILHGKDVQVSQIILELCFVFASVYEITILRTLCLERFSSFINTGPSFLSSFLRIASNYPAPWKDTLLLAVLTTAPKGSPVVLDLKDDSTKLLDLCRTVETNPMILGKLLWFLRDNSLVPARRFTELKFLPKFLTLEDGSFSVVKEFCIQITKDCISMVTPPATPPTPPNPLRSPHHAPFPPPITRRPAPEFPPMDGPSFPQPSESIPESSAITEPEVAGSSDDALDIQAELEKLDSNCKETVWKFFQEARWRKRLTFDQVMELKKRCVIVSTVESPHPLLFFIDFVFNWLAYTNTIPEQPMFVKYTFSAATRVSSWSGYYRFDEYLAVYEWRNSNWKSKEQNGPCPVKGCLENHPFEIEVSFSKPFLSEIIVCTTGHDVVFYYGVVELRERNVLRQLRYVSLVGKARNPIKDSLKGFTEFELVLVLRNKISNESVQKILQQAEQAQASSSHQSAAPSVSLSPANSVLSPASSVKSFDLQSEVSVSSVVNVEDQISQIDSAESAFNYLKHWRKLKTFEQIVLLRDKCIAVSTVEDPGPLFLFVDHMFLWLNHTETSVTKEIRERILSRLPQLLLPAAFSEDLRLALNYLVGIDSEPKVKNQNKKFVIGEFTLDKVSVLSSLVGQKCILVKNEKMYCPIEGCESPHPFEVRLGITAPYKMTSIATSGHKVVFSYIITTSGSGTTKKWISLQGLGRKQIREMINGVNISKLVLIFKNRLPAQKQAAPPAQKPVLQVSTFSTQLTTKQSIREFVINESWLKLTMKQLYEVIAICGKVCPRSTEAYLCVDAMMAWGQFKRIKSLTSNHFGRLCEAWQNCRLNWTYMSDVRTGFSLFDGIDRENTKLEKTDFTTFLIGIPLENHSIEHLKKQNCLPLLIKEVQCEVRECCETHDFRLTLRFPEKSSTLLFNGSRPIKTSTLHFDLILHYYMVVERPGKSDFFFPIAVMNKNEIFSFIEGERKDNPKSKFLINVVFSCA